MLKSFLLTVSKVVRETPDAVSIHFPQPAFDRIWYRSGQFLTLRVFLNDQFHYRSYSISTVAGLDDTLAITVKRLPGGLISNYLFHHLKPGDSLEVSRPLGRFGIENSVKEARQLVLLGAGSGITPLFSILRATLFQEPLSRVALLYANRTQNQIIFRKDLEVLTQKFPDRFHLQQILSQPEKPLDFPMWTGRVDSTKVQKFLSQMDILSLPKSFYICGPEAWMQMIEETLLHTGIAQSQIFFEHFFETETQSRHFPAEGPLRSVSIDWGDRSFVIQVPAGATILDAALSQGLELPHSCKTGTCASCMGKLVSGEVSMENNESLLDFEVEQGKVLLCQAHPLSEEVTIRIGWYNRQIKHD